jgi:DNA-directed RNA polymerase specialized sigma24 family protein
MVSEERIKNWAWWTAWGHIGPEIRTRAASAEGNYDSEDVWEGEEPRLEPDMVDGEIIEQAVRKLQEKYRKVLKARYIMYPYHLQHTVAQRLRMSVDRLESELNAAKRRLSDELNRNQTRDAGVVTGETWVCNSVTSK